MRISSWVRQAVRESRGMRGRLSFFVACLAIGVAAVVAVAGLSASLRASLRGQARELLAADLAIEARRPLPAELSSILGSEADVTTCEIRELTTIAAAPASEGRALRSVLVDLKAIGPGYPFYGQLVLEPAQPWGELLDASSALVSPSLLAQLQLAVGEALLIAGKSFTIRGTVLKEPDRIEFALASGPRVLLSMEGLERAGLVTFGSRVEYRTLVQVDAGRDPERIDRLAKRLEQELPDAAYLEIQTYGDAQPTLRQGVIQVERFLGLIALLSLMIGGIGVAQAVRAWIVERMDSIAVLRCLGCRPVEVAALYLGQALALGMLGSAVGAVLGVAVQYALPLLLGGLISPAVIDPWQPGAFGRGFALGIGVALVFSIVPLASIWSVSPLRVLRRDAEPLPLGWPTRVTLGGLVVVGVLAAAWYQSERIVPAITFTGALLSAVLVLRLAAWGLTRLARRWPERHTTLWSRHGLAALTRPGGAPLGAVVALGLGVMVVLAMQVVQDRLAAQLGAEVPETAPSAFLLDIQTDQWSGIEQLLQELGALAIDSAPVITGRLASIEGRTIDEITPTATSEGRARWVLTREQRLTYGALLPPGNRLVEGSLWSDPERHEISIERDFAEDLGVEIGSKLVLDIQGVPIELLVTSMREVEWRTFGINFFMLVEPGALEDAPQFRLATARMPEGKEQLLQDRLVERFPNVTVIQIREVLNRVLGILRQVSLAVRALGGFTVVAGIAILAAAVSANSLRRGREVALLKTLGMTRRQVILVFAFEYTLIGAVAGAVGAVAGGSTAWLLLRQLLDIEVGWPLVEAALAALCAMLLAVIAGLLASARALLRPPSEVLRGG